MLYYFFSGKCNQQEYTICSGSLSLYGVLILRLRTGWGLIPQSRYNLKLISICYAICQRTVAIGGFVIIFLLMPGTSYKNRTCLQFSTGILFKLQNMTICLFQIIILLVRYSLYLIITRMFYSNKSTIIFFRRELQMTETQVLELKIKWNQMDSCKGRYLSKSIPIS